MSIKGLSEDLRANRVKARDAWTNATAALADTAAPLASLTAARDGAAAALATIEADRINLEHEKRAILQDASDNLIAERARYLDEAETSVERLQIAMGELDGRIKVAAEQKHVEDLRRIGSFARQELEKIAARLKQEAPKAAEILRQLALEAREAQATLSVILKDRVANREVEELQFATPDLFIVERLIEGLADSFVDKPTPIRNYVPVYATGYNAPAAA